MTSATDQNKKKSEWNSVTCNFNVPKFKVDQTFFCDEEIKKDRFCVYRVENLFRPYFVVHLYCSIDLYVSENYA